MYVISRLAYIPTFFFLFFSFNNVEAAKTPVIRINKKSSPIEAYPYINILTDTSSFLKSEDIIFNKLDHLFIPFSKFHYQLGNTHWIRFKIFNEDKVALDVKISIPFTDYSTLYIPLHETYLIDKTGDHIPLNERSVQNGQMCLLNFKLTSKKEYTCYIKIQDNSSLAKDFQDLTIRTLKIYSDTAFFIHFEKDRIYHAFFFGALTIMFCFNFFIFFSTRSKDYLYYIIYLLLLIIFYASNLGYLLETILTEVPRVDLFIRMLSPPLLIVAYIKFSKTYLQAEEYAPRLTVILNFITLLLFVIILMMIAGFWRVGRSCVIISAAISFVAIFIICATSVKKYTPARFFMAGNLLLISASTVYAIQHFSIVSQHSFSGYGLQIAILVEVILFSQGLADRINIIRHKLNETILQQEIREKEIEKERIIIIQDKNKELELSNEQLDTFFYRTAHDLRGPIASIMGLCQLALQEVKDNTATTYLTKLNTNSNKLNFILERLYTAYKIKNSTVSYESVNIKSLITQILTDIGEYEKKVVNLKINNNLIFHTDPLLLRYTLLNIIENALKFYDGDISSHCIIIEGCEQTGHLLISVSDNGIGIKDEDLPFIFDLFSKAALPFRSTGLGLYIAKAATEKLKGKIIYKRTQEISTFTIEIPTVTSSEVLILK